MRERAQTLTRGLTATFAAIDTAARALVEALAGCVRRARGGGVALGRGRQRLGDAGFAQCDVARVRRPGFHPVSPTLASLPDDTDDLGRQAFGECTQGITLLSQFDSAPDAVGSKWRSLSWREWTIVIERPFAYDQAR